LVFEDEMSRGFLALLISSFSLISPAFAQTAKATQSYKAQVIGEEPYLYEKPNFDAKILQTLQPGKVYDVAPQLQGGAFYKMRGEGGVIGYVSDADVKPLWNAANVSKTAKQDALAPVPPKKPETKESKEAKQKAAKSAESADKKRRASKTNRPFQYTQFVGIQYSQIEFTEDTMGDKRKESMGFFGVKLSGPDLVIEGEIPTEVNFMFHSGAPGHYERLTGNAADGWIFLMNFLLESYFPQGKSALTFIGFGPELRYSKFNAALTDSTTGKASIYSMEDIGAGAVFNAGMAVRMGNASLRGDIQYHWEKQSYLGAGLSLQMAF
jgi:hypothetical protein